uniref:CCR4-NOT transcription complex subunit 3 (inferred by orthology to a human protein) n=1 Tax=Strongyloides venezuelensis TaxID=75913 RepID=A0A0K0FZL2_STRVS
MAEKRKLMQEIERTIKKIDDGMEEFDNIMEKMRDAISDNQREKLQDDLKKEIKKLQRLRDQVKGWVNCSEIKDKDNLLRYRRLVELKMEEFKDIERENKTKPHSKQGLSAEEKVDPREKEKHDVMDWLSTQIRSLQDHIDLTESKIELLANVDNGKRRKGKDDSKKGAKEKQAKVEEHRKHLERLKYHQSNLEVCMRLVNNEELAPNVIKERLQDDIEAYVEALGNDEDMESYDPDGIYDDLDLSAFNAHNIAGVHVATDEDHIKQENGDAKHLVLSNSEQLSPALQSPIQEDREKHANGDRKNSSSPAMVIKFVAPLKMPGSRQISGESSIASPPLPVTPPPPPSVPYNSVAAGKMTASGAKLSSENHVPSTPISSKQDKTSAPTTPSTPGLFSSVAAAGISSTPSVKTNVNINDENSAPTVITNDPTQSLDNLARRRQIANGNGSINDILVTKGFGASMQSSSGNKETNSVSAQQQISPKDQSTMPVNSVISSDAGIEVIDNDIMEQAIAATQHMKISMNSGFHGPTNPMLSFHKSPPRLEDLQILIDLAFEKMPQQTDSEFARPYLPRVPVNSTIMSYPRTVHPTMETLDYYLRLGVESLFFTFYYMEGTRAQLLAAKALKKQSWRFHTKYNMWFQRQEEPKTITDEFEKGSYLYFDFERWLQKKKDSFLFEFQYLEDVDFDV